MPAMILALAVLALQADAAGLLARASRAVDEAKSLRAELRAEITRDGTAASTTWTLLVRGDRARLACETKRGDAVKVARIFVAGTTCTEFEDATRQEPEEVHRETARRLQSAVSRVGLGGLAWLAGAARYDKKARNDVPDAGALAITDAALAGEEDLGGRRAWKITYRAAPRNATAPPMSITAWIDQERVRTLKLASTVREGERTFTIVEHFARLDLNCEIADDDFRVPEK
jgi:hypothetical protein